MRRERLKLRSLGQAKPIAIMLFMAIFLLAPTGCWDYRELNKTAIIVGNGIDSSPDQEIVNTLVIALPSSQNPDNPFCVFSAAAPTLALARARLSLVIPRLQLGHHASVIIIGEEMARNGVGDVLDFLARSVYVRETAQVFIARGCTAKEILEKSSMIEKLPSQLLKGLIDSQRQANMPYPSVSLLSFVSLFLNPGIENVVPAVAVSQNPQNPISLNGLAVFKLDRLVGWLNSEEVKGYHWLAGKTRGDVTVYIPCPLCSSPIMLTVTEVERRINVEGEGENLKICIDIRTEGNFYEQRCTHGRIEDPAFRRYLEQEVARQIALKADKTVHKAQALGSDIFGWGQMISRLYPHRWQKLQKDWCKVFPSVQVEVQASYKIKHTGLLTRLLKLKP